MAELQRVLDAPPDPAWIPEDREFKQQAEAAAGHAQTEKDSAAQYL